ncbi:MAG TPA: ECF transporter S component [Firmicutes bacterium]|nr:ECF transporter S component [Bacillota bacterium]
MNMKTKQLVYASFFLALGIIVPQIFHFTGLPGTVFLPMHIPVLLCGFILGPKYGLVVGALTPLLNSLLTGMPPVYPVATSMMFELATYGLVAGLLYQLLKQSSIVSLIGSMLLGRVIGGIANAIFYTASGTGFVLSTFITASFVTCFWGIVIQLVIIPIIVKSVNQYFEKSPRLVMEK